MNLARGGKPAAVPACGSHRSVWSCGRTTPTQNAPYWNAELSCTRDLSSSHLGIDHSSVFFPPPPSKLHSQAPNPCSVVLNELRASVCAVIVSWKEVAMTKALGQHSGFSAERQGIGAGPSGRREEDISPNTQRLQTHVGEIVGRREPASERQHARFVKVLVQRLGTRSHYRRRSAWRSAFARPAEPVRRCSPRTLSGDEIRALASSLRWCDKSTDSGLSATDTAGAAASALEPLRVYESSILAGQRVGERARASSAMMRNRLGRLPPAGRPTRGGRGGTAYPRQYIHNESDSGHAFPAMGAKGAGKIRLGLPRPTPRRPFR